MVPPIVAIVMARYARDVEADKFDHWCWSFPRRCLSYGWKVQRRVSGSFFSVRFGFSGPGPFSRSFTSTPRQCSHTAFEPFLFFFLPTHFMWDRAFPPIQSTQSLSSLGSGGGSNETKGRDRRGPPRTGALVPGCAEVIPPPPRSRLLFFHGHRILSSGGKGSLVDLHRFTLLLSRSPSVKNN